MFRPSLQAAACALAFAGLLPTAHASGLLAECNDVASSINQSAPQAIDKITTLVNSACFADGRSVVLQYRMRLSVTGQQVDLNRLKPNMVNSWCTDPQLRPLLNYINVQYSYSDPQGRYIGRVDISQRNCR